MLVVKKKTQKGGKNEVKGCVLKLASSAAAFTLMVAVSSVRSTCHFTAYQPNVSESLQ